MITEFSFTMLKVLKINLISWFMNIIHHIWYIFDQYIYKYSKYIIVIVW